MRARSWARALVAAVTCAAIVAPFMAAPAGAAQQGCANTKRRGLWVSVDVPDFSSGQADVSAYGINAVAPEQMFVTNGTVVQRTSDGGCRWSNAFVLPQVPSADFPYSSQTAVIESIAVMPLGNTPTVLLRIQETLPTGTARPHVAVSKDGGATWVNGDVGLPPAGAPDFLRASPTNPSVAYLGIGTSGDSVRFIYASVDGGTTWQPKVDLQGLSTPPRIDDITINPTNSTQLWGYGAGGLYISENAGESWRLVDQRFANTPTGPVDVFQAPPAAARVMAFRPGEPQLMVSSDGGASGTFSKRNQPAGVDSVGHGATADQVAVSANGDVYAYMPSTFTWRNLNAPASGIKGVTVDLTASRSTYGFTTGSIEIYLGQLIPVNDVPLPEELINVPVILDAAALQGRPASLGPDERKITLDPREHKKVKYTLQMPRTPVPLDVFFLVDTSGSMTNAINGTRRAVAEIATALNLRRVDVLFGLAEYRSYPDRFPPRSEEEEDNFVYRRVLDIADRPPEVLQDAIGTLVAEGGGNYDAHLGALYQAATGEGQDLYPPGDLGHDVPPGLDATWREKALRVLIHITDERFGHSDDEDRPLIGDNRPPEAPDIPTHEEVRDALNRENIEHVGLSIGYFPKPDLARVSNDTGTQVVRGGVDCDGDGDVDLEVGAPLVCRLSASRLGAGDQLVPAIINLLDAVSKKSPVELEVTQGDKVVELTPDKYQAVLLQAANTLDFTADFHCPLGMAGRSMPVTLRALALDNEIAEATARVVCREVPEDPIPPPPALGLVDVVIALFAPPPLAPPPPIAELSSSTQAQSQAQAQGAAAYQEQEQPQMAFVNAFEADEEEELAEEYLMAAYEERTAFPVEAAFALGAAAIAMSFGFVSLARSKVHLQIARANRR